MRKKRHKVAAGSLLITVVIALVLGLICSLLILSGYHELRIRTDRDIETSLNRNLQSAVNMVLAGHPQTGVPQSSAMDLYGKGNDSVIITEGIWGVYDFASVEARVEGRSRHRNLFFGPLPADSLDGCLYLAEHQRSLSLVGNTRLTGKAYLPKGGIKPGYINQRGYDHSDLVNGPIWQSTNTLPDVDIDRVRYYGDWLRRDSLAEQGQELPDTIEHSFTDAVQTIHRKGPITLSGVKYAGHIIIGSDSLIEVDSDVVLNGVLLIAPVVRFRRGFSGKVQAFGTDSIIVEEACHMRYPSALVIVKENKGKSQPRLVVGENSVVEGLVLTHADDASVMTLMELRSGSLIRGIVYSNGFLSPEGGVYGTVLTDYFIYRSSVMVYENYLVDTWIDRRGLPDYFAGPSIFNSKKKNRVIQWVD